MTLPKAIGTLLGVAVAGAVVGDVVTLDDSLGVPGNSDTGAATRVDSIVCDKGRRTPVKRYPIPAIVAYPVVVDYQRR